ncbi:MAG: hypothetical protein AUK49_01005 [Betaproteobacteria bacterium CG2_30_68_42]|nr:MAG: hypothetical protein AUK49_01005 [Betaproteobacteria bacterium CG2_30_68_42]
MRWQVSQDCVVGMWLPDLPVALDPLWQVEQLPGVTLPWSIVAGFHPLVRWQVSQDAVVAM